MGRNQSLGFINDFRQKVMRVTGKAGLGALGAAASGLSRIFSGLSGVVSTVFFAMTSFAGQMIDFRNSMANIGVFFENSIMEPVEFASSSILVLDEVMKKFREFPGVIASLGVEGRRQFAAAIGAVQQDIVRKSRFGLTSEEISATLFELAESMRSIGLANQIAAITDRDTTYRTLEMMTEISSSFATSRDAIVRAMRSFSQNVINRILMANLGRPGAPMTMGQIGGMGFGTESQQAIAIAAAALRGRVDPEGQRVIAGISTLGPRIGGQAGDAIRQSLESLTRSFGARTEAEANELLRLSRQQMASFAGSTAEEFESAMGRIYDMMRSEPLDSPLRALLQDASIAATNLRSRGSAGISREEMGTSDGRRRFQENLSRIAAEESQMAQAANALRNMFVMVQNFFGTVMAGFLNRLNRQGGVFERITRAITALTSGTSSLTPFFDKIASAIEALAGKFADFLELLGTDPTAALNQLKDNLIGFIESVMTSVFDTFGKYISPIVEPLIDIAKLIGGTLVVALVLLAPKLALAAAAVAGLSLGLYGLGRAWDWVRGWLPTWLGGRTQSETRSDPARNSTTARPTNATARPTSTTAQPTTAPQPQSPSALERIFPRQSATTEMVSNTSTRPQHSVFEENRRLSTAARTNANALRAETVSAQNVTPPPPVSATQIAQSVPISPTQPVTVDQTLLLNEIQRQTQILDDIRIRIGTVARNTG
jgi:hypothetical protein